MNRYSGPSRATPNTVCQKCLQKGHYSYECTASAQQRPYAARPSRTQQLLNPSLAPKLTNDAPNELMRKKGIADEILGKGSADRGRKRLKTGEDDNGGESPSRSPSTSSSASVSTVSTNKSRTPTPQRREAQRGAGRQRHHRSAKSRSRSTSIDSSGSANERRHRPSRVARRSRSASPVRDDRRDYGRSRRNETHGRDHEPPPSRNGTLGQSGRGQAPRLRSLSPYSKRLALTEAMNQ